MDNLTNLVNQYHFSATQLSAAVIVFKLLFSFALQLVIVWVWRKTHSQLSYFQSFVFTLIIMGVLATAVMMVVQNNIIGAIALLGALSIIRFRTIIKETKDISFVFFAMTIGIAVGTSNYAIALLTTFILSVIIISLFKLNVGRLAGGGFLLIFSAPNGFDAESLNEVFKKHTASYNFLNSRSLHDGRNQFTFSLHFRDQKNISKFLNEFKNLASLSEVEIVSGERTVQY